MPIPSLEPKQTFLQLRDLQFAFYEWGDTDKPTLFLVHGWMDTGASFKYMAPELVEHFHLISFDLRGFGYSDHVPSGYWFPDYYADLDAILEHFSSDDAVNLVGHSMGANISLMFSGIRPERVSKVMALDWIGLPETTPKDASKRFRSWLNQLRLGEPTKIYQDLETLKKSIRKGNPSFSEEVIDEIIPLWTKPFGNDGQIMLLGDHKHRNTNPIRYNFDDVVEIWNEVTAQVGLVMASDSFYRKMMDVEQRVKIIREALSIKDDHYSVLKDSHHMLHIEKPVETAERIISFFRD